MRERLQRKGRARNEQRKHDAHVHSRDPRDIIRCGAEQSNHTGHCRAQHEAVQ